MKELLTWTEHQWGVGQLQAAKQLNTYLWKQEAGSKIEQQ